MTRDSSRWETVKALFAELSELPASARAARLDGMTFGDPALREEVAALLAAAEEVGDRFEGVALAGVLGAPQAMEGVQLGGFRVVRCIGRGGMGMVYEATRADGAFEKRVAIKMVAPGSDSEAILRRFRYERQILARLEHRNIAALLDGGVTPDGAPYFVMEYVDGERIDHYCDRRRLGVRERLSLFRQVCAAVHYAHQSLVVHRDLKPGNILVAADGTVKLLDFGIAKLLAPEDSDGEPLTQTGLVPMTAIYASPEQLRGEPVTTASDVYALGVVLYQLLAGRPPVDPGDVPVLEARRRLLESTPLPPSRRASVDAVSSAAEPSTRSLQRAVAGDLDNIVMMALRKEPERRYASAEALGEDVLRFMAGLPIQATPDSLGYRLSRLVQRNRVAAAAAVLAVLVVLAATAVSIRQAVLAGRERDRARIERTRAEQVTAFLGSIFLAAAPDQLGRAATVVEAMDAAIPRIDSTFAEEPWIRARLLEAIGSTYFELNLPERAESLFRVVLAQRDALDSGRVTYDGATAVYNLAGAQVQLGRLVEAESLFRRAMAMYESIPGVEATELARGWGQLANVVGSLGRHEESLALQERVVAVLRAGLPPGDRGLPVALTNYAAALTEVGRLEEAEPLYREAVRLLEERNPADPTIAGVLQPLAQNLHYTGQLAAAESVARRSVAIAEGAYGRGNTATLVALRGLLNVLVDGRRCEEAIPMAREVVALRTTGLPPTDLSLGSAYLQLGECLGYTGDRAGAEDALREGVALRLATLPPDHWAVGHARSLLGEALVAHGKVTEGRRHLAEGLRLLTSALGPDHFRTRQGLRRAAAGGAG